jgi:hypothetical protein
MKFYLAARYSRIAEMREVAHLLVGLGHEICCRWIESSEHDIMTGWNGVGVPDALDSARSACAVDDVVDIHTADCLICFSDPSRSNLPSRGGHNVELGVALGAGKTVYVIGPRENIFFFHPAVRVYGELKDLLAELQAGQHAMEPASTVSPLVGRQL